MTPTITNPVGPRALAAAVGLTAAPATAQTTILDFWFDDPTGTALVEQPDGSGNPDATIPGTGVVDNSGNGNLFDVSDDDPFSLTYERTPDRLLANQADGAGRLAIGYAGGFDGNRSSTSFVQFNTPIDPAVYDRALLTLEVAPWSFEDEVSDDDEEIRIGFGDASATNQTAQFRFIVRDTPDANNNTGIALNADALGDGATDSPTIVVPELSLNQTESVTFEIDVDYTTNTYAIRWQQASDATPTEFFSGSLGSDLGEVRAANFLRLGFDDDFSDDTLAFERLTVTAFAGTTGAITGDYDQSGQVEQGDLDIVLQNWGTGTFTGDEGALVGDGPFDGTVDQNELDGVLQNWGSASAPSFDGSAVPEPAAALLLAAGGLATRRQKR